MSGHTATPGPWRVWDVMSSDGKDEYPEPHAGDVRLVGANDICIGVTFGGYASLPECNANAAFIVTACNSHADLVRALEKIEKWVGEFPETGRFWDKNKTDPMSYSAAFGSNGERDFMRDIARAALATLAARKVG